MNYMDSLHDQLEEKDLWSFWVFPDRSGFIKIKISTEEKFEKIISKEVNKYKNRWVVNIRLADLHNETDPTSHRVREGIMLMLKINAHLLDENAKISCVRSGRQSCNIAWTVDDFKVTKISFKLIERLMYTMLKTGRTCPFFTGYPLRDLIEEFEKDGYDFSDVLNPLAGL